MTTKTTEELLQLIHSKNWYWKDACEELIFRLVPPTDPEVAWRGGVRPTRPNP